MCIRDRITALYCADVLSFEDCVQLIKLRSGLMADAAKGSICLLYTSDAADEEDSVDLGGRRIIKKKWLQTNVYCWT